MNTAKMVIINEYPLINKKYQEKMWVTFKDIDKVHGRPTGTASRNFKTNKKYFIEGQDYIIIKHSLKDEFYFLEIPNRGLILISETGYLKISQSSTSTKVEEIKNVIEQYFKSDYKNIRLYDRLEISFIDNLIQTLEPFNYTILTQYNVLNYRLDAYIPELNLAIEYDENDHKNYTYEEHEGRQEEIENELKCKFVRVSDKNTNNYNIGLVFQTIVNNYLEIKSIKIN